MPVESRRKAQADGNGDMDQRKTIFQKEDRSLLNSISIMGRLTRDPELRQTQTGKAVANFTIACDRDHNREETDFIDVVAWGGTAEFVNQYFGKGQMAVVKGRLQLRKYEDRDGNKRTAAEIIADNVYFGEAKRSAEPNP